MKALGVELEEFFFPNKNGEVSRVQGFKGVAFTSYVLPWGVPETQLLWQHLEGKVKSNGAVTNRFRLATSKLLDIYE